MKTSHAGFNPTYQEETPTLEEVNGWVGDTLLEFGTPWCGYCQAAQPAVQEVLADCAEISHIKVYDGKGKRLGRSFRVKLWPTFILLHNGKEVARVVRPTPSGGDAVHEERPRRRYADT